MSERNSIFTSRQFRLYSAMAAAFLGGEKLSNSQVVYTDLDPDQTFDSNGQFIEIDLNNDAVDDVRISVVDYSIASMLSTSSGSVFSGAIKGVFITPLAGAEIAGYLSGSFAFPYAIDASQLINADLPFQSGSIQSLINYQVVYNYPSSGVNYAMISYGYWNGMTDRFLGIRFEDSGETHYGYIRLDVSDNRHQFTVKAYAWNASPDEGIVSGDMGDFVEESLTEEQIELYSYHNIICVEIKDPSITQGQLSVYNVEGEFIASKEINAGLNPIQFNTIPTGIYVAQFRSEQKQSHTKKVFLTNSF